MMRIGRGNKYLWKKMIYFQASFLTVAFIAGNGLHRVLRPVVEETTSLNTKMMRNIIPAKMVLRKFTIICCSC